MADLTLEWLQEELLELERRCGKQIAFDMSTPKIILPPPQPGYKWVIRGEYAYEEPATA